MKQPKIPIACSLTDAEFRKRRTEVLDSIKHSIMETIELKNGYIFSFPNENEWILKLAEMITLERECCPFINFKVSIDAGNDRITLSMTGQKGTKEFVSGLFL